MTFRTFAALVLVLAAGAGGAGSGESAGATRPLVLAYAGDSAGSLDVYVATIGRTKTRRLTTSPRDEFSPSWSPDGSRIAYRVNPPRSDEGDIWIMRADGTGKRNLTRSASVADW